MWEEPEEGKEWCGVLSSRYELAVTNHEHIAAWIPVQDQAPRHSIQDWGAES